jgi:hypothetical protein
LTPFSWDGLMKPELSMIPKLNLFFSLESYLRRYVTTLLRKH